MLFRHGWNIDDEVGVQEIRFERETNKWQDRLWGPAQELNITLHIETYSKNRIKYGHNSTKIGANNIFGGNQLRFKISA